MFSLDAEVIQEDDVNLRIEVVDLRKAQFTVTQIVGQSQSGCVNNIGPGQSCVRPRPCCDGRQRQELDISLRGAQGAFHPYEK